MGRLEIPPLKRLYFYVAGNIASPASPKPVAVGVVTSELWKTAIAEMSTPVKLPTVRTGNTYRFRPAVGNVNAQMVWSEDAAKLLNDNPVMSAGLVNDVADALVSLSVNLKAVAATSVEPA